MKNRKLYVITILCLAIISAIVLASCTTTQAPLNQQDKPNFIPIEYGSADFIENAPQLATIANATNQVDGYTISTDGGIRNPQYYHDIPDLDAYELQMGTYGGSDANHASHFGNIAPEYGGNGGRNDKQFNGKSYQGWDQSSVYAVAFYTNIKLSKPLITLAKLGIVNIEISCKAASGYHNANGFVVSIGFSNTDKPKNDTFTRPSGDGGSKGSGFNSNALLGDSHGSTTVSQASDSSTIGHEYSHLQPFSYTADVPSTNIDNGGMRLFFMLGSDRKSYFRIG
ncbi:MAG: hypothetical protein J6R35_00185, partial [Clostridia bacterium]|nr:hypothetical protein [Clostridia bacterium]